MSFARRTRKRFADHWGESFDKFVPKDIITYNEVDMPNTRLKRASRKRTNVVPKNKGASPKGAVEIRIASQVNDLILKNNVFMNQGYGHR